MPPVLKRGVRIDPLWNGVTVGGRPLAHGKVLAFEPDTGLPKQLWKSSDRTVPWSGLDGNQVELDANGKALAYGYGVYQLVVCDRNLTPIETWEPRFYGHMVVSARDFGAVGAGDDSMKSDTAALQAAIDHCLLTGAKLFIPAGTYKLTDALRLYRLLPNPDAPAFGRGSSPLDRRVFAPFALEIVGEKGSHGIRGNDTRLCATFRDRPALVIQGARGLMIHRLSIEGLNGYALEGDPIELLDDRTFVEPGCRDGDNRLPASPGGEGAPANAIHSPYAAVAIDPFGGGGPPPDGGYPGFEEDYHRAPLSSAGVTIEQCSFSRFVVGVLVAPSGAASHPEDVAISSSSFEHNKVSVAVCAGTSESVRLSDVRSFGNLFFVSTCSYGDGAPSAEIPSIRGATVEATKHLFHVNAPDPPVTVEGVSCESTLSLGFIESGYHAAHPGVTFIACNFDFAMSAPAIDAHLSSTASVRFESCSFAAPSESLPIRFFNAGPLAFGSCTFLNISADPDAEPEPSHIGFVGFEAIDKVTFEECFGGDQALPNQVMVLDRVHRTSRLSALNRTYVLPGSLIMAADVSPSPLRVSPEMRVIHMPEVLVTPARGAPGEGTFLAPDPTSLRPGDLVYAEEPGFVPEHYGSARRSRGVCGVIKSITGAVVRMRTIAKSFPWGRHDLSVKFLPRLHTPSSGVLSLGSDLITEVENLATWSQFDRISGPGIPEGAYVTDVVDPRRPVLRMSKRASASGRVRLYDADVSRFTEPRGAYPKVDLQTLGGIK